MHQRAADSGAVIEHEVQEAVEDENDGRGGESARAGAAASEPFTPPFAAAQSAQSDPSVQYEYSAPGPPSSHSLSLW